MLFADMVFPEVCELVLGLERRSSSIIFALENPGDHH
jgi:hypothetical protein